MNLSEAAPIPANAVLKSVPESESGMVQMVCWFGPSERQAVPRRPRLLPPVKEPQSSRFRCGDFQATLNGILPWRTLFEIGILVSKVRYYWGGWVL